MQLYARTRPGPCWLPAGLPQCAPKHPAFPGTWHFMRDQTVLMAFSAASSHCRHHCAGKNLPHPVRQQNLVPSTPAGGWLLACVHLQLAVHFCCLSFVRALDRCLTITNLSIVEQVTAPYNVSSPSGKESGKTANATRTAPSASPPYNTQQTPTSSPQPPAAPSNSPAPQAAAPAKAPAKSTSTTSVGNSLVKPISRKACS